MQLRLGADDLVLSWYHGMRAYIHDSCLWLLVGPYSSFSHSTLARLTDIIISSKSIALRRLSAFGSRRRAAKDSKCSNVII